MSDRVHQTVTVDWTGVEQINFLISLSLTAGRQRFCQSKHQRKLERKVFSVLILILDYKPRINGEFFYNNYTLYGENYAVNENLFFISAGFHILYLHRRNEDKR